MVGTRFEADLVVYVLDKSGSMFEGGSFELLKAKLIQSLAGLRYGHHYYRGGERYAINQRFHVLFFGPPQPVEFAPRKLVPATPECVGMAAGFVESDRVRAEGGTRVLPALARALEAFRAADPEGTQRKVIFLLSDGGFDSIGAGADTYEGLRGNAAVVAWLSDHNPSRGDGRHVDICTCLYRGTDPAAQRVMERIAADHGGTFEQVSADE